MLHKRKFKQLDWITDEEHDAQTADLEGVNGILHMIEIKITSVTDNPSVDVTLSDITEVDVNVSETDFDTTLETFSTLADGTLHKFLRMSKEYDANKEIDGHVFCWNNLRISVDPSADPGGSGQTLAVDVTLYLEE